MNNNAKCSTVRRLANLLLVTVLAGSLSGCATVITRAYMSDGYASPGCVYPATRMDICVLTAVPRAWRDSSVLEVITAVPCVLLDLPLSLTFDTLLLPYDIWGGR